jgi:hypothetical protein
MDTLVDYCPDDFAEPRRVGALDDVLAYRNDPLVDEFGARFRIARLEADEIFEETKKWLWLTAIAESLGARHPPDDHVLVIDEMWRLFTLLPAPYAAFCDTWLGGPLADGPAPATGRPMRSWRELRRQRYALILDLLGGETLSRWYQDYPVRYAASRLGRARPRLVSQP